MSRDDLKQRTAETAKKYFAGVTGERPYDLWRAFDPELARDLSLFVTGSLYAREKIPHPTRQLVAVAALTVLGRSDELRLHVHAALNVGCPAADVAEVIFQMATYGGVPVVNQALHVLRDVLGERGEWPMKAPGDGKAQ
jgi:4-carboxymuconolactone decarboxylase